MSEIDAQGGDRLGNVSIDPVFVILNRSRILTTTNPQAGGNIALTTQRLLRTSDSTITSANALVIDVLNPANDLAGSLARLPVLLESADLTLQPQCSQLSGALSLNSFLIRGRGSVTDAPGTWRLDLTLDPPLDPR